VIADVSYRKLFKPNPMLQDFRTQSERRSHGVGDRRDGKVYLYTDKIVLAVNVAIATGRPLLVQGVSGCGKSSLAYNIARVMRRRYYEFVVSSRTQARDLLWRFDAVRRLGDAQAQRRPAVGRQQAAAPWESYYPYIEPGVLWWAFDPESARRRGRPPRAKGASTPPAKDIAAHSPEGAEGVVILIDEIDKAEPDFSNNLLVPLGSLEFTVEEIGEKVRFHGGAGPASAEELPLVIITSNQERRLPQAFLRRCVILDIDDPTTDELVAIAKATEGERDTHIYEWVAQAMQNLVRDGGAAHGRQRSLSTAEYLDAVRACVRLGRGFDLELFESVVGMTTWKETGRP
jgi:MoxR-like ATPase